MRYVKIIVYRTYGGGCNGIKKGRGVTQTLDNFILKTCVTAGIFNLVLNPFFAWLSNMDRVDVPRGSMAVDTVITCILMCLLVTLFTSADTRRALKAGSLARDGQPPRACGLLCRLPSRPWKLGILLGLAFAAVVTPCMLGLIAVSGISSLSFFAFALLKAVYTPLVAYAVARWTILRHLAAALPE